MINVTIFKALMSLLRYNLTYTYTARTYAHNAHAQQQHTPRINTNTNTSQKELPYKSSSVRVDKRSRAVCTDRVNPQSQIACTPRMIEAAIIIAEING